MKLPKLTEVDKFLAALAGFVSIVIERQLVHGTALTAAQYVSGALSVALVYLAQPPSPKPPAG